ncbi:TadE/TadG family type IV pilus assembly protein [Phreatobacter oligotrophus]|jgi:Flp pilus assembly protein TadG|uniref:Flp pilus assembly protein TadG n=1 Tax=Phreatobacter oligotrophus TaxID=1122261 RepID=A0A2T4YXL5_9HYPH|nr:TadE/TadG family type IV pilus assembly protein [Phreatobacter oligotrophus]PTM51102.1 Flp pilus assembly protein TadG [Phreatobacter oligotrophus]
MGFARRLIDLAIRPVRAARVLAHDKRGVSAVEFALVLPLMVTLFLATVETTQGLQADRKVSLAARALSDLASQATTIADADMSNILDATADVIAPFNVSNAQMVVTGIQTDILGVSRAVWSDARNATRYSCGQVMTIPNELKPTLGTTGFLVLAEVKYSYTPTVAYLISGSLLLSDRLYTRPRIGETVSRTPKQGATCI